MVSLLIPIPRIRSCTTGRGLLFAGSERADFGHQLIRHDRLDHAHLVARGFQGTRRPAVAGIQQVKFSAGGIKKLSEPQPDPTGLAFKASVLRKL